MFTNSLDVITVTSASFSVEERNPRPGNGCIELLKKKVYKKLLRSTRPPENFRDYRQTPSNLCLLAYFKVLQRQAAPTLGPLLESRLRQWKGVILLRTNFLNHKLELCVLKECFSSLCVEPIYFIIRLVWELGHSGIAAKLMSSQEASPSFHFNWSGNELDSSM